MSFFKRTYLYYQKIINERSSAVSILTDKGVTEYIDHGIVKSNNRENIIALYILIFFNFF